MQRRCRPRSELAHPHGCLTRLHTISAMIAANPAPETLAENVSRSTQAADVVVVEAISVVCDCAKLWFRDRGLRSMRDGARARAPDTPASGAELLLVDLEKRDDLRQHVEDAGDGHQQLQLLSRARHKRQPTWRYASSCARRVSTNFGSWIVVTMAARRPRGGRTRWLMSFFLGNSGYSASETTSRACVAGSNQNKITEARETRAPGRGRRAVRCTSS